MSESEINNNNSTEFKKTVVEEDDDVPTLSADTMAALLEFYAENKVDEENKQEISEDWVGFDRFVSMSDSNNTLSCF